MVATQSCWSLLLIEVKRFFLQRISFTVCIRDLHKILIKEDHFGISLKVSNNYSTLCPRSPDCADKPAFCPDNETTVLSG